MDKNIVIIVGCGNIGSKLAQLIQYRKVNNRFEKLYLVDDDILIEKNTPFLGYSWENIISTGFNNKYKIDFIKHCFGDNNSSNMEICNLFCKIYSFEDFLYNSEEDVSRDSCLFIDCRDTDINQDGFDVKLNQDGEFGRIRIEPDKKTKIVSNYEYLFRNDNYAANILVNIFCFEYLFNIDVKWDKIDVIINCYSGHRTIN